MGGTTAKAALIEDGRFLRVNAIEVGGGINIAGRLLSGGGYPVRSPAIDIAEVGAGGGSMARLDAGGALRVGPESAGAAPGPVCYDRGGVIPTVTDANVILGFINPVALAGGGLPIRRELAVAALQTHIAAAARTRASTRPPGACIASPMRRWRVRCARSPPSADATRAIWSCWPLAATDRSTRRHWRACSTSAKFWCRRCRDCSARSACCSPRSNTTTCAPTSNGWTASTSTRWRRSFSALEAEGAAALDQRRITATPQHRFERLIDLRYAGANSELTLPCPADHNPAPMLGRLFGEAHERQYGYRSDEETIETMNLRVIARAPRQRRRIPDRLALDDDRARRRAMRAVYFGPGNPVRSKRRCASAARWAPNGETDPLLIEEFDSTTVVPPDGRARLSTWDTIEIELE